MTEMFAPRRQWSMIFVSSFASAGGQMENVSSCSLTWMKTWQTDLCNECWWKTILVCKKWSWLNTHNYHLTSTFMQGDRPGKVPINGCWVMDDLSKIVAGWLAVHKCPGDHQIQMIDINAKVLLGKNLLQIVWLPAWWLSCWIPQAKEKYKQKTMSHLKEHKVLEKLQQVYANIDGWLSPAQITEVECIDRVWVEGMIHAEKRCQKLVMGEVNFSPKIELVHQCKHLWTSIVQYKQGGKVNLVCIWWKAQQCGVECPLSCTLAQPIWSKKWWLMNMKN